MDTAAKRAQIEAIFDVFNRCALDELDAIFHPDYVDHTAMRDLPGVPAFKESLAGWLEAFPDAHFSVSNIIIENDSAARHSRLVGTNMGSMMGMSPTGKSADVSAIHYGRLSQDGRPTEHGRATTCSACCGNSGSSPLVSGHPVSSPARSIGNRPQRVTKNA